MRILLLLLIPSVCWSSPFIVCDPSDITTSYIVLCNKEIIEEVSAEPNGSIFYDIAGKDCLDWAVVAVNASDTSGTCTVFDSDCDGDIDGKDLGFMFGVDTDLEYFANKFGNTP